MPAFPQAQPLSQRLAAMTPRHPFEAITHPPLPPKPRSVALTSVMDKGTGPAEAADRIATAGEWIDVVKLGWATARLMPAAALRRKVEVYSEAGIPSCSGGTFLEIAFAQNRVREFLEGARDLGLAMVEVSNGVHPMSEEEKLGLIAEARKQGLRVWSEVGKKDPEDDARLSLENRVDAILRELDAGAEKVILEARESGTVGIYDRTGKPASELIHRIVERVGRDRLVFEAPHKAQQLWMIRTFGRDVNLGNVPFEEALSLATLRTGLRGDTFAEMQLTGLEVFLGMGVHGAIEARQRGGIVVLIDALRASATIVTALESGMAAVRPVASPEECVGEVTSGERGGRKLPHVKHGNSPTEILGQSYAGKTLVLTTTNGVECLLSAVSEATIVLVGTTLNRRAVAAAATRLAQMHGHPITLLMAGRNNQDAIEDSLAAGEIVRAMPGARVHGDLPPFATALEADFFASDAGRNLVGLGYADDVRFCAQLDCFETVPVFREGLLIPLEV
ncbi:MAG TPA: phosphosulfolactate synthase [Planctomycetota bacterium]|nr:phosphosulfolactate synthase [Planctomycetota bacterium]